MSLPRALLLAAASVLTLRAVPVLTDLGTLGGSSSTTHITTYNFCSAASFDGSVVVGYSMIAGDGAQHGFLYNAGVMTDLGTLGGSNSFAKGVSANGAVVYGVSDVVGDTASHAFLYSGGVMTGIGTFGGTFSSIFSASANGSVVVGESGIAGNASTHGFIYAGGVMTDLGTFGGVSSSARLVSADGSVVAGSYYTGADRAFIYTGGVMTDIGTLGGSSTSAYGLSSDGSVLVGYSNLAGDSAYRGIIYSGGVMTDIGTLGGTYSSLNGISANGLVSFGSASLSGDTASHSILYSGGVMTDIDVLLSASFGSQYSQIFGISADGSVAVGYYALSGMYNYRGFYYANGVVSDMGDLGGAFEYAAGVSGDGSTIFGNAEVPGVGMHAVTLALSFSPPTTITTVVNASDTRVSGGSTLQFQGGTLAPIGLGPLTLTNGIEILGASTGTLDAGYQDIASTGAVTIAGTSLTLTGSATSTISLTGDISGAGILINANGNNVISGTNTSAGISVTGGSLRIASAAALPATGNSVSSGGTLILNANLNATGALAIAGDGAVGQLGALVFDSNTTSPTANFNSLAVTLTDDARIGVVGGGQVYLSGAINGASPGKTLTIDTGAGTFLPDGGIGANIAHVVKEGSGMLYLRSSIIGDVTVNAGTFYVGFASSTGSGVTVNAGGNLFLCSEMGTPVDFTTPVTLAGSQTLRFGSYAALTQSGQITVAADSSIESGAADNVISGGIVGSTPGQNLALQVNDYSLTLTGVTATSIAQLTKTGAGALLIDTTAVIKAGELVVANGLLTNNGAIDGAVTVASGSTLKGTGTVAGAITIAGTGAAGQAGALVLQAPTAGYQNSSNAITLSGDAKVALNGTGQHYLSGVISAAAAGKTLTIDTGAGMFYPDGGIGANVAHVVKDGSGWLYLRAAVAGDVIVNAGTYYAGVAGATGAGVTVNAGAGLQLNSDWGTPIDFVAPLTLSGAGALLINPVAPITQSGAITLAADSSIESGSQDNVISGGIAGSTPGQNLALHVNSFSLTLTGVTATSIAQLTKTGAGALLIDTTAVIKAGELIVADGLLTNNGAIDGAVTVASGSTLKGTGTVAGAITIAGTGAAGQAGALVLQAPTAGFVNSSHALTLSGDAKIALNGTGQHYHAGLIAAASPGKTLTIDTGAGMFYPDGGIGANVAHVVKDGSGMLYLRAAVAGDVTINAGSYHAGVAGATGAGVTVNAGASLRLNSDWGTPIDFVAPLTLSGAGALQINPVAPITQSGAITLAADSSIESGSQDNIISGAIAGATPGQNLGLNVYDHTLKLTGATAASIAQVTKTGAGTLLIDSTAVIDAGSVVIADGLLTNNGSISGTISVTGTGVLGGSGTINGSVTINGVLAPGNSPGIQIQASGDTTLTAGSRFQAQLGGTTAGNGDGFHDQYYVQSGRLNLDPGVTLDVLSWVKADGVTTFVPARRDVFTVIRTSDGIAGVFSDLTNANYSQWMLYDNAPTLHALGKLYATGLNGNQTFADYASTPARAAIGASLWTAAVTASNSSTNAHPAGFIDGDTAFGKIVIALLTAPDADAFLGGLSPDAYLAVGNYALTVSRSLTEAAFAQSSLIRTGAWTVGAGYNRAQHGYVGASSPGYDLSSDTSLVTLAYDFGAHCSVGFFFGQNRGKTVAAESRIDYRGSVFGLTSVGRIPGAYPVTLKGALIASDLELDANRSGSVSGAQGLRSLGGQLMAAVELYKDGRLTLSPTLGFVHGRSTAGAFAETGSGANLAITNIDQDSSRLIAGFGLTYLASTDLTFDLSAAFEHEYAADAGSVSATFGGVGDPMTSTRAIEDRDSTTFGLGASWKLDHGTTVRLGAEVRGNRELSKDYRYNASVNVRF